MAQRLDRLALFAHLWAVATLSSGLRWLSEGNAWGWAMIAAATGLAFLPRSLRALVAVMLVQVGFVAHRHPFTPNHLLFEALLDLCFLVALALAARKRPAGEIRDACYEIFAPAARVGLLVLYFFAVLHKLNRDFFDPQVSCGAALVRMIAEQLPVPDGPWAQAAAIWGTLLAESALPVLLCLRRTRLAGVLLGVAFHTVLALVPETGLYSFSTMMFALLSLFLPPGFADELSARWAGLRDRGPRAVARRAGLVLLPALVAAGVLAHLRGRLLLFGLVAWCVWWLALAAVCFPLLVTRRETGRGAATLLRLQPALWVFPLILLLNGFGPYLGLKTLTSFSMVSNLRTEGEATNHLFLRRWIDLTGLQDDLVRVRETSVPELWRFADDDLLLTYFEFRRICSRIEGDFRVDYERNGTPRSLERVGGVSNDPEAVRPHPWLRARLLGFRPVDAGPRTRCRR